jgi:hypothetical protein
VGGNALPGESLRHVADIHWQFELFKAGLLPKLEITDATAETLSSSGNTRIVKVTAKVTNTGQLATHVARGASLEGNRQDAIWLIGDRDRVEYLQGGTWQSLGTIGGTLEIPGAAAPAGSQGGRGGAPPQGQMPMQMMQQYPGGPGAMQQQAPQTGNTREVTWLISIEGNSPLKLVLTSQKGGTRTRDLTVR